MSLDAFAGLIGDFGRSLGLPDAKPDADGYCAMSFDELVVNFQYADGDVTLFSRIGEVDEDRAEDIYGMLLAANIFWQGTKGATLSVEPDTRVVFIAASKPLSMLNTAAFNEWLGNFVNIAEYWEKRLASANAGQALYGEEPDDAPQSDPDATHLRV